METSARLRELLDKLKALEHAIRELKAEKTALKAAIAEERARLHGAEEEHLIALGRKAILQSDAGMTREQIARQHHCGPDHIDQAMAVWRHYEGLAHVPNRESEEIPDESHRPR